MAIMTYTLAFGLAPLVSQTVARLGPRTMKSERLVGALLWAALLVLNVLGTDTGLAVHGNCSANCAVPHHHRPRPHHHRNRRQHHRHDRRRRRGGGKRLSAAAGRAAATASRLGGRCDAP
ncbi:unnamed protein product [Prorocentrum cordatum]|uniref:Uncharacterized protein n=1 Tax=Prorocentrum cordatum TaxID=2364126 RepID=A0ABN9X4S0_9DINO|nr:unnamed protein product [Polarella glacialis]